MLLSLQTESYYISLIKGYYNADCIYLKKKYKKSFKEIWGILQYQEKKCLELQEIFIDYESQDRLFELARILQKKMDLFASFKTNLFEVNTTEIIPEQLWISIETGLKKYREYMSECDLKIRQETLF